MIQHFLDQFVQHFYGRAGDDYPQVHHAVWTGILWVLVLIRNNFTAWMV